MAMLTWIIVALLAALCLLGLCLYVSHKPLAAWDRYFVDHSWGQPSKWQLIEEASDPRVMVAYAFILAAYLVVQGRILQAAWALITLAVTDSLGIALKRLVHRTRPAAVRAHYSFPSGHVLGATAMALMMVTLFSQLWLQLLVVVLWLLIAASRLSLKAHYLSDILAAICLSACVYACSMIAITL